MSTNDVSAALQAWANAVTAEECDAARKQCKQLGLAPSNDTCPVREVRLACVRAAASALQGSTGAHSPLALVTLAQRLEEYVWTGQR